MQALSSADLRRMRLQAQAEMARRRRSGKWRGGAESMTQYQQNPIGFIVDILGVPEHTIRWSLNPEYANHRWHGDKDPLVKTLESLRDWHDCAVESATGTGKTFLAACITFWFLGSFENSLVITAAPKEDQLLLNVWKEIGALFPKFKVHFPQAELFTGKIRMRPAEGDKEKWAATAFVAGVKADEEVATKARGSHAPHMLHIVEEMPGVPTPIIAAFDHTRTADHNLMLGLGNPEHRQDTLHRFGRRPHVHALRISAYDFPNIVCQREVIPGGIGQRRLDERIAEYGKGTRLYEANIEGICPLQAEEALIRWEWCEAAAARYNDDKFREGPPALGVDVSQEPTGDPSAFAFWKGACLTEVRAERLNDASKVGQFAYNIATDKENPIDPRYIGVDSVGVGASAVNEMRRLGLKVRHISSGKKAVPGLDVDLLWSQVEPDLEGAMRPSGPKVIETERFDNMRSQVWWRMREDLRLGRIALPFDEELFEDLTAPKWTPENGQIKLEKKTDTKARIGRSPNKGDAAVYGNFVRRRRPVRENTEGVKRTANRDTGLEHMLKRLNDERIKKEREFRQHFRNAERARRSSERRRLA